MSPFLIYFYRGMGILTPTESRDFPPLEMLQEGEEVVLANEVNSDLEVESRNLPQKRKKRCKSRQDSQPRKKRRIDEAAVAEERLRRTAPIDMQSPNFRVRSKMKARRLILGEDSSTESRRATARGRFIREARLVAITNREKEVPVARSLGLQRNN